MYVSSSSCSSFSHAKLISKGIAKHPALAHTLLHTLHGVLLTPLLYMYVIHAHTHAVPPQDVQLHSRGESSVTLSWSRPDPSRVQNRIPALTHSNYTITCSARDSHMVQVTHKVTISQQSRNVTITGLDLTASDYHCCVAADYRQNGYSPKSCVNTSSTTDDMITNINTTDHEGNASNTSSTSVSTDIVPSSPLTSTTGSSSPLTSATGLSSLPAVGGALFAAAIVVLLVTLGTCGGIIVHMKWKANRKRMNSRQVVLPKTSLRRQ